MNNPVLQAENLHKIFTSGPIDVEVLTRINLTVQRGEQIAVVGSSGSGKSTLLHLLGGLDLPTSGHVQIGGKLINQLSEAERSLLRNKFLGFVYQFHHLLPEFTALENICVPLLLRNELITEAREKAMHILQKMNLENRKDHRIGELSGGERQRIAIARALVTQPLCLLADEPTGNLDKHTAARVYETMLELNKSFGTSLIIVTHDPSMAAHMDRTLLLENGELH